MDGLNPEDRDGRLATIALGDGHIGIAWHGDTYALHFASRIATDVVFLDDRDELRRLALEMVPATQLDLHNPSATQFDGLWGGLPGLEEER
jgi:hypothetical protein